MSDCNLGLRLKLIALILLFFSLFFFLSLFFLSALKICVIAFSGTIEARILKLGIHLDNELLYCGVEK